MTAQTRSKDLKEPDWMYGSIELKWKCPDSEENKGMEKFLNYDWLRTRLLGYNSFITRESAEDGKKKCFARLSV